MSSREALSWLKKLGVNNVILELDALNIVIDVNNLTSFRFPLRFILQHCSKLMSSFDNLRIVYAVRFVNHAAHLLIKTADSSTNKKT